MQLTKRLIVDARLQAETRSANNDTPLSVELDAEARKLGYRGWNRLINVYRSTLTESKI